MPSSHTQLALFVACFWNLQRARRRRFDNGGRGGDFVEEVLTSLAWLGGVLVGYSRVYLGYHSVRQVIVGGVLGVVFGAVWFELVAVRVASWLFRVGFYEWEVARVLGLRDSSTVGNVVAVEREALMRVVTLRNIYSACFLPVRIGHGFDIHRMTPLEEAGQLVVIGGVVITNEDQKWKDVEGEYVPANSYYKTQLGLIAHSDGDVIYHSIVDAIFGALTLPDIGQVFQDTDPRWKGCDSSKFMDYAYDVMEYYG
eukprot:CAMPEP_0172493536 /NCGR_PEP_ID=MMETSP1066-20121228/24981_1 /TAXON_ID=671091 /ORGANISM="Coscinodiscus wailesii, Strain CCMP2513" /LENGTH=254 /DNA_ID=CAMNT_0013263747 /DNA_START=253 /DNA_END=1014 /DNA_ORIENTATION=+